MCRRVTIRVPVTLVFRPGMRAFFTTTVQDYSYFQPFLQDFTHNRSPFQRGEHRTGVEVDSLSLV